MTRTITIKSTKGTTINLIADSAGFVTAEANGTVFRGRNPEFGVMMQGSRDGDFLSLGDGANAGIAAADIRAAAAFFDAAKRAAAIARRVRAEQLHNADMDNEGYRNIIASAKLTADINRRYSDN
jgi:hypothetical protein